MRILYLNADRGIPVRGHKGAAVHVRALTDALVQAGHIVTIFTPRPGPADGPAPLAQIVHCPLPELETAHGLHGLNGSEDLEPARAGLLTEPAGFTAHHQAQAYAGVLADAALAWLADNPCDAIYERYSLWSDAGARLRAATGLPLVLEVNAPLRAEAARHRTLDDDALAAQVEATQFAAADHLAVVSQPLADYVIAHGADPARVHVVPNAVDPQHFHPAVRGGEVRERYGLHGRTVLGFAGRMRPWHDGPTLLRAFTRLHASDPTYHLLLVGEMDPELLAAVEAAGLVHDVTCTGPVPHEEVPQHLAAMDVAVSSHAAAEAGETFYFSPLKLFEYLACGVPTVAADVGQPAELIRPGHNGYLYPPGDDAALAAAIGSLVQDPAHARDVAWNGAALVLQEYTWALNAARVTGWLAESGGSRYAADGYSTDGRSATAHFGAAGPALPILDAKLRQRLYRATRPDLAAPLLARQLPGFRKKGLLDLERLEVVGVLKYKPGRRCVLAYALHGRHRETGQAVLRQAVGKVFRDERGERLLALQERLYRHGFGPDAPDGIDVPQPLAYIPEMRMLLQARVPGETLDALALRGGVGPQAARAGQALAKLHSSRAFALPSGNGHGAPRDAVQLKPYALADELRGLEDYTARLAQDRPDALPAVQALRAALLDWAATLPAPPVTTPLHRDFYYSQVLYDGPHLHLIDFDLLAQGDPAIDVANFSAHLAYLGLEQTGDVRRLAGEAARFLAAYCAAMTPDPTFAQRVAFYQAATWFRLLNVVAPRPAVRHLFEPLLAHTEAALRQPVPVLV